MQLRELVAKTRSYRRFKQDPIPEETLRGLVDLARMSPTGSNLQPLKFFLSWTAETNARIFPCLAWAGSISDWDGPGEGERPTAYILILVDTDIWKEPGHNVGIAAQSIVLGAMENGIGACMIASLERPRLAQEFNIPGRCIIPLAIALGVPGETVVTENIGPDGNVDYYRDADDVHHVPKRTLDELIVSF
ncbi:MAG: nitroreductase family protein [Kiritimatiellia bacterium]|jgi:nitroreductase|nr:nitroreductase family protein [Kiritimatiellia bacterium]